MAPDQTNAANAASATIATNVVRPIDLTASCNAGTTNAVGMGVRSHPNNLAEFPTGELEVGGIRFLVTGMIQLATMYPKRVDGISVGARGHRLHLLHGTGGAPPDGAAVALLTLHYADGSAAELPIVYGEHVRDWWTWKKNEPAELAPGSEIAWVGDNAFAKARNCRLRVYRSTFDNPKPDLVIEAIDYARLDTRCNPFMLGLSIE
jgi:hypothetical protein